MCHRFLCEPAVDVHKVQLPSARKYSCRVKIMCIGTYHECPRKNSKPGAQSVSPFAASQKHIQKGSPNRLKSGRVLEVEAGRWGECGGKLASSILETEVLIAKASRFNHQRLSASVGTNTAETPADGSRAMVRFRDICPSTPQWDHCSQDLRRHHAWPCRWFAGAALRLRRPQRPLAILLARCPACFIGLATRAVLML